MLAASLADLREEIQIVKDNIPTHAHLSSTSDPIADAPVLEEATRSKRSTVQRRLRRNRARQKCQYQRTLLLQMRHIPDIAENKIATHQLASSGRVINIESAIFPEYNPQDLLPVDLDGAFSADTLDLVCQSARVLQRWWRKARFNLRHIGASYECGAEDKGVNTCLADGESACTEQHARHQCQAAIVLQRAWRRFARHDNDVHSFTSGEKLDSIIDDLMVIPRHRGLKRHNFVQRAESLLDFLEKQDADIDQIELFSSASVALVSYSSQGSACRKKFLVEDKSRLVKLVQERGLRIASHLQKPCPEEFSFQSNL